MAGQNKRCINFNLDATVVVMIIESDFSDLTTNTSMRFSGVPRSRLHCSIDTLFENFDAHD